MGARRFGRRVGAIATALLISACTSSGERDVDPVASLVPMQSPTSSAITPSTGEGESDVTAPIAQGSPSTTSSTVSEQFSLAVDPSVDLFDGDIVTVTGRGLGPNDYVVIGQCVDNQPLTVDWCEPAVFARSEGRFSRPQDGTLIESFRVSARFATRSGELVDCRDPDTGCLLAVASVLAADPLAGSTLAITFDPDGELAEPGASISHDSNLYDGQAIALSVWGIEPAGPVAIGQCLIVEGEPETCETEIEVFSPRHFADDAGRLEATAWAQVEFEGYSAGRVVSCRPPARCSLYVSISPAGQWEHPTEWSFPLTFDPDAPIAVPPEVTIDPSTDLIDGQRVAVGVSGMLASMSSLIAVQCARTVELVNCDLGASVWSPVSQSEALVATVHARLTTEAGEHIDCRRIDAGCYLAIMNDFAAPTHRWGIGELTFDPTADLAPPPTVRIVDGNHVEDRTYVTIIGSGFPPDGAVEVAQCPVGWFVRESCSSVGFTLDRADENGTVRVSHPMLATAGAADCGEAGQCEVRVVPAFRLSSSVDASTSAAAPVTVSVLVPEVRYLEPIFDDVEVRAGVVYGTGVDEDGNEIELTLDVYLPAGDEADDRPVILWGRQDAVEFARRGFVVVTTHLEVAASRESIELGYLNTLPVFDWLDEHAEELRIDTDRIAAAGQSRGGFIATTLAYGPVAAQGEGSAIAAAISLGGGSIPDLIEPGEPPSLMIHGGADGRVPVSFAEGTCEAAARQDVECTLVVYEGRGHDVGLWNELIFEIWDRVAKFLVDALDLG